MKNNNISACITYISSRKKCISLSLQSLWDNFNHKHEYPVYVHYFDDIYDDEEFRENIRNKISKNIHFVQIDYETPAFLKEDELFYNRRDVWYARTQFPISRKGYLHMCHFMSNYYGYPNTHFEKYDYVMSLDDESAFVKELPEDPFEVMSKRDEDMGALIVYDQTKKTPHQGNFDTRINLWDFIKGYIKHYKIEPKSQFIKNLMIDPDADKNFHFYPCADSYVVKTDLFKTQEWKNWIEAVNKYGGIYKYRWGDNDINSLFYLIHYDHDIHDLKIVEEGYHVQNAYRHIVDYAPGVRDNSK